jgi:hypothetical protein
VKDWNFHPILNITHQNKLAKCLLLNKSHLIEFFNLLFTSFLFIKMTLKVSKLICRHWNIRKYNNVVSKENRKKIFSIRHEMKYCQSCQKTEIFFPPQPPQIFQNCLVTMCRFSCQGYFIAADLLNSHLSYIFMFVSFSFTTTIYY